MLLGCQHDKLGITLLECHVYAMRLRSQSLHGPIEHTASVKRKHTLHQSRKCIFATGDTKLEQYCFDSMHEHRRHKNANAYAVNET